jgi:glycerol transport system substrate-binding protein
MFWYTAFTADMVKEGLPVMNEDGTPKWRMAPSPHGAYWQDGMKVGYQDAGSWTLLKSTPIDRAQAAWLYAQFVTSKTVDVKKSHVGLTFIRESTIQHESFTERAPKLGGLVEFYRSPARVQWSPTGDQRAGLSEAGAAVVAEHRRCHVGGQDPAGSARCPVRRAGKGAGAA